MCEITVEYRRTAVIKLDTPEGIGDSLRETVEQFKHCANTASEWCWHGDDGYHVTSKAKAEQALYDRLRDETTSQPYFSSDSAVYDKRSATFHRDHVSLSTVDGRVECDYILPDDSETPPTKYVSDEDFEFRMAHLQYRDGDWYLYASMRKAEADEESPESESKHRTVLDVDLGVNNLAVASTGRFWSADEFNHWRREYEKRRTSLQQCGSRHAHENVESVGQKEYGRFEIHLHTVANELIGEAVEHDCSHVVFEELTHIRENVSKATWQHIWAFRRLSEYVEYKAKDHGVEVVQVDPRNTSKRCSTCGFT